MIFYYALGGGLGHVTRAQALVHTLGLTERVNLAFSSAWDEDPLPISAQFHQLRAPTSLGRDPEEVREEVRGWLSDHLSRSLYRVIIIDAFPGGILGELCGFKFPAGVELVHCARLLRWPVYNREMRGALPRYDRCYLLEEVHADHLRALHASCDQVKRVRLFDPPYSLDEMSKSPATTSSNPLWLILHSGPPEETRELTQRALESAVFEEIPPRFLLIAPRRPPSLPTEVEHLRVYPAHEWVRRADRVFTACGFNTVRQLAAHRAKHIYTPLPRRFDDQYARAAALRSGAWDQSRSY